MNPDEYVELACKTCLDKQQVLATHDRFTKHSEKLHAAIGICTEAGELQDALKKHLIYGKQLDTTNIEEELGDLMWYIALMCKELGCSLSSVMQHNIDKLQARYAGKFTETAALNRDLDAERKTLEKQVTQDYVDKLCQEADPADICARCNQQLDANAFRWQFVTKHKGKFILRLCTNCATNSALVLAMSHEEVRKELFEAYCK